MRFTESELPGVFVVDETRHEDERGFFARTYSGEEFAAHGLSDRLTQSSVSFNPRQGTLRGLHFQEAPFEECKLVRCTAGAIFDVAVDIRPQSTHYRRWFGVELNASNGRALYLPAGFAHGFLTLRADSEVLYTMTPNYSAAHARGFRWDDPAFDIHWPAAPAVIASRDAAYPLLGSGA
jgi:dTDP-4-dehydrorhamnose 3,5-epimerase